MRDDMFQTTDPVIDVAQIRGSEHRLKAEIFRVDFRWTK